MAAFYINRIKAGRMTLGDVPVRWYGQVKEALEADN